MWLYNRAMNLSNEREVEILWEYMQMHQQPHDADCLLVLGSRDDRVARYAGELAQKYRYQYVLVSGGAVARNDVSKAWAEATEAEHFAAVMKQTGYDKPILIENESQSTGENALKSYKVLQKLLTAKSPLIELVTKPYMERRALATFEVQWPGKDATFSVTSPNLSFDSYINDVQPWGVVVNIMVGDMQRIMEYPRLGYQSEQPIPNEVKAAFEMLVAAGFTSHLLSM